MSNAYFVNVCKVYELLYYAYYVFDKMFELHVSAHEFENRWRNMFQTMCLTLLGGVIPSIRSFDPARGSNT